MLLGDDADLDAADLRYPLAFHRRDRGLVARVVGAGEVPDDLAIVRIRLEDHLGFSYPVGQDIGSGPDRMRVGIVGVGLDYLTRDRRHGRHGHDVGEVVIGFLEVDAQRIAIDQLEPPHRSIVVEPARLDGSCRQFIETDDFSVNEEAPRGGILRIHEPFDGISVVRGGQLTTLAFERGVWMKVDALADMEQVHLAVVVDLRQRLRRLRNQLRGPCQIIVGQQRLENLLHDLARIIVGHPDRIETGFLDLERDTQNLVRIRGLRTRQRGKEQTAAQSGDAASEQDSGTEHCFVSQIERRVM